MNKHFEEIICAPVNDIHYCPICGRPYLEKEVVSAVIANTVICPDCSKLEKDYYSNYINYISLIRQRGTANTFPVFN